MKHELDTACKNFAMALQNSSSYNTTKKSIVYKKSATLLVVRRDMVRGNK